MELLFLQHKFYGGLKQTSYLLPSLPNKASEEI